MLIKKCDIADMKVCEEYKVGDVVVSSIYNIDPRIKPRKKYTILDVWNGLIKISYEKGETDWYSKEDFVITD